MTTMPATAPVIAYPKYAQGRNEEVTWLPKPVAIGRDADDQAFVVLGISTSLAVRTVEALIIDRQESAGNRPVMLGRLWKFSPGFGLQFNQAALQQLAKDYDLVVD